MAANSAIWEQSLRVGPTCGGMGTTLTAAGLVSGRDGRGRRDVPGQRGRLPRLPRCRRVGPPGDGRSQPGRGDRCGTAR